MNPSLISKIKGEGALKRFQNIQHSAINNLLSIKKLNRMLSTETTLKGNGLSPDLLLEHLYSTFFDKKTLLDNTKMTLQIRFIERINQLTFEKKLNPRIKITLIAFQKNINRIAKKRKKIGTKTQKNHFNYLFPFRVDIVFSIP